MDLLRDWLSSPQPDDVATPDEIIKNLRYLAAAMPSKSTDDETGKRKLTVYVQALAGFSLEAIKHMARRARDELKWFPVVSECLPLARSYKGPEILRNRVEAALRRHNEAQQGKPEAPPITDEEIRVMSPSMIRMGLAMGEFTQERVDRVRGGKNIT